MINNETTEIMNTEQKPELVQQPPITYTYPSDASRDERLKAALLALLNSDLIKVAGNKFTKQDLIEWVERIPTDKPAEWSEEDDKIRRDTIRILETASPVLQRNGKYQIRFSNNILWLKSLRPQKLDASKLENFDPVDVLNRIKKEWPTAWEKVIWKQEWSEDDEKIRKTLLDYYEKALDNYACVEWLNGITYGELCDFLKALRPSGNPAKECLML